MAEEMIIVHNFIIRSMNSIYLQCVNVAQSPADVPNFVDYAMIWAKVVEEHHHTEETTLFPAMEELTKTPGIMGDNIEQHKAFHGGLEIYEAYLTRVKSGNEKYDGLKLKGIIDGFMPVLREHLNDEIDTLLALKKFEDTIDWETWFKKKMEEILKKADDPSVKVRLFRHGCFFLNRVELN
jgi:hemerythrin-like domain-containing protein